MYTAQTDKINQSAHTLIQQLQRIKEVHSNHRLRAAPLSMHRAAPCATVSRDPRKSITPDEKHNLGFDHLAVIYDVLACFPSLDFGLHIPGKFHIHPRQIPHSSLLKPLLQDTSFRCSTSILCAVLCYLTVGESILRWQH